jgi:hypothetical protein
MSREIQSFLRFTALSWQLWLPVLAVALLVAACGQSTAPTGFTDACGYTWKRARPASSVITVIEVEGSEGMPPGVCREDHTTTGCHVQTEIGPGRYASTIWINKAQALTHPLGCDTLVHELNHAAGYDHPPRKQ